MSFGVWVNSFRLFISRNNVICWKGTVLNLFLDCQVSPGGHFTVRRQEGKSLWCEEKTEQRLHTRIYFHVILFLHYYRSHLAGPSYSFPVKHHDYLDKILTLHGVLTRPACLQLSLLIISQPLLEIYPHCSLTVKPASSSLQNHHPLESSHSGFLSPTKVSSEPSYFWIGFSTL